jgi:glutaminyl-peptide cyclotransferase
LRFAALLASNSSQEGIIVALERIFFLVRSLVESCRLLTRIIGNARAFHSSESRPAKHFGVCRLAHWILIAGGIGATPALGSELDLTDRGGEWAPQSAESAGERSLGGFHFDAPALASSDQCGVCPSMIALSESERAQSAPKWNGARAMLDIERLLAFGPRSLDAAGHGKAISYIREEMAKATSQVDVQRWTYQTKEGTTHALTNVIARFDPTNPRRIIVGTHFDSIGRAYRDRDNPNGVMPGANNSGSGVAVLIETARMLAASRVHPAVGIDFVFFDGEEGPYSLGEGDPHWFPLGSPYFAARLDTFYPLRRPEKAVIFDMVCYKNLKLRQEQISLRSAPGDVSKFWTLGREIAPDVFLNEVTAPIADDQGAFAQLGIPSILVIGFEYDPWFNTTKDTLDKCSPSSLEAVGRTLLQFLHDA